MHICIYNNKNHVEVHVHTASRGEATLSIDWEPWLLRLLVGFQLVFAISVLGYNYLSQYLPPNPASQPHDSADQDGSDSD